MNIKKLAISSAVAIAVLAAGSVPVFAATAS